MITNTIVKASFDPINQCTYTVQAETLTRKTYWEFKKVQKLKVWLRVGLNPQLRWLTTVCLRGLTGMYNSCSLSSGNHLRKKKFANCWIYLFWFAGKHSRFLNKFSIGRARDHVIQLSREYGSQCDKLRAWLSWISRHLDAIYRRNATLRKRGG